MSQALYSLSFSLPVSSKQARNSTILHLFSPNNGGFRSNNYTIKVKALAGENRDNLDHLQQPTSSGKHQQQAQPRKRFDPVSPSGLWDRFPTVRRVQQMMDTMERMIEDSFTYSGGRPSPLPSETGGYSRGRSPREIKVGENEYKMRFDIPGMTKEDVKVWVEEKILVVKAEKVPNKKNDQENGQVLEEGWSGKSYGRYRCRIALPENLQFEKITAEVKDGVLYVTIPKASSGGKILDINVQ